MLYVPALVNFSLYPLKRRKGHGCLYLGFMQVLYVGAVSGSALSVTDSNRTCQCPAGVSLELYTQLCYFWNLLGWAPVARQDKVPGLELREVVSAPDTSLNTFLLVGPGSMELWQPRLSWSTELGSP